MNYFKPLLITLFLFPVFSHLPSMAQTPELINDAQFGSAARAAVDSIYNFRFDEARHLLEPWEKKYPGHPLWTLVEGMVVWWNVLSDLEDTSNDERLFSLMGRADYESSELLRKNSSHADALIIKAISNGYIARHYTNRGQWVTGMNRARKAYYAYQYLLKLQPDFSDLMLAEGLKLYYAAHLPESYPIVKTVSWFLPEGDKQQGLEYMQMAADSAIFASAEALYFLGNINYNYENNYSEAANYFETLYQDYPRNNFYVRLLVQSYYHMNRYEDALDIINKSIHSWENRNLPYRGVITEELLTWKGRILYKESDRLDEAIESFKEAFEAGNALPRTQHRTFHVVAGYYLGRLLHQKGQHKKAVYYLKEIRSSKADSEYKKLADRLINEIENEN